MTARKEFVDIWSLAQEEKRVKESEKGAESQLLSSSGDETHVFFIGSRSGGKTSLILHFLEREEESPKPTTGLEYTYGRKSRGANLAKDVCHIWELGGGTQLSQLIEVPLTADTISQLRVVIVVDLSRPGELWDTLEVLINQVRKRFLEVLSGMKTTSPKLVKVLKTQASHRHGEDHPDKDLVSPLLAPTAIIGTKYDLFQEFDPEKKKIISKTLRFVAHMCGASLVFCSHKSDSQLSRVHQLISHFAFKGPLSHTVSMDHNKPITVPVGSDALGQIGAPSLSSGGDLETLSAKSPFDLWRQAYNGFFPQVSCDTPETEDPCKDKKFFEHAIDTLRAQKDEELNRYIRECERREKQRELRTMKPIATK